jgi:N-acetyl-anhydromuramyl-L-alanine amidase AmpD
MVPEDWMPACRMDRIICHWTAGGYKASEFDRGHYHLLVEADGNLRRGIPSIAANARGSTIRPRAEHTRNCNTGSIGLSLCCMREATERDYGPSPMTAIQFERMCEVIAILSNRYGIPITPQTVLSHAEVQQTLGIQQRGKIDFIMLPFAPEIRGAINVGNHMRDRARDYL